MYHKINLQNGTPTMAMNSKALKQFQQMGNGGRNIVNTSKTQQVSTSQFQQYQYPHVATTPMRNLTSFQDDASLLPSIRQDHRQSQQQQAITPNVIKEGQYKQNLIDLFQNVKSGMQHDQALISFSHQQAAAALGTQLQKINQKEKHLINKIECEIHRRQAHQ